MAIQTRTIGSVGDPQGGQATLGYDFDDATLLITTIRVVNNSSMVAHAEATSTSTGRAYSVDVPPGQTLNVPIGGQQANRLQLVTTPSGKLDGVESSFRLV
jgi:hypothetical protein